MELKYENIKVHLIYVKEVVLQMITKTGRFIT